MFTSILSRTVAAVRQAAAGLLPEVRCVVVGDLTHRPDRFGLDHYRVIGRFRFRSQARAARNGWVDAHAYGSAYVVPVARMPQLLSEQGRPCWRDVEGREVTFPAAA